MDLEEALMQADVYAESEEVLVIDNDLRTITIPSSLQIVGVESDEDVRRLYFQMPKQYHEVDLSEFDIRINFMNANNQGDVYAVTDKQVTGDNITFSWLVGRNALAYRGNIRFIVCLKKTDAEGVVQQEFNTTIAQLTVLEGLETTEAVVAENPDVIEQILARLDELEENGGGAGTPGKDGREIEIQNNGTAIQWRYAGDDDWTDLVQLSDITGAKGDPGDNGITPHIGENGNWYLGDEDTGKPSRGEKGNPGDKGEPGDKGDPGQTGETPNIKIGTVQTLDPGNQATASMSGTPENPLLNLGIPKGEKGDPGEDAESGDSYTLPIMSDTQLGGGKAVAKTDEDVPVAVDSETGQLFVPTYPSGGGTEKEWELLQEFDYTSDIKTVERTDVNEFDEIIIVLENRSDNAVFNPGWISYRINNNQRGIINKSFSENLKYMSYCLQNILNDFVICRNIGFFSNAFIPNGGNINTPENYILNGNEIEKISFEIGLGPESGSIHGWIFKR